MAMTMSRAGALVSALAVVTVTAGCATSGKTGAAGSTSPRTLITPTSPPCVTPTAQDIAALAAASTYVIEGTIPADKPHQSRTVSSGKNPLTLDSSTLTGVKVLAEANGAASVPTSVVGSTSWADTLGPGRYLFFLLPDGAPVNGMYGVFDISHAGAVGRRCPNYRNPASPLTATDGVNLPVAALEGEIPRTLSGPAMPPAKPIPVSSAPPG